MYRFFVPGPLPGLNEIISSAGARLNYLEKNAKRRVYKLTQLKEMWDRRVEACFVMAYHEAGGRGEPDPVDNPVVVKCEWVEKDRRRDPDNIFAGVKFVLDGLRLAGVLNNDGWKWIKGIEHSLGEPDRKRPGVWVTVRIAGPGE